MNAPRGRLLRITTLAAMALAAIAGSPPANAASGDVTISVLTMGPGDQALSKFGHDAIVVEDGELPARVYNFGTFSFESPTLFQDFLRGRLRYWLSVEPLAVAIARYRAHNRSVLLQELELSDDAARDLSRALAENALPANRNYLYDHFRDNCATRIRDALDRATGGTIRLALNRPATESYRDHALRLVADGWLLHLGLDLGLGPAVDRPITEWDEAFLPERLALSLRRVRVSGSVGDVPLVAHERMLFEARRDPSLGASLTRAPWLAALGTFLGGMLALFGRGSSRAGRIVGGLLLTLVGTVSGLVGTLLSFLWTMTNNEVAHSNANALLSPAFSLVLVPVGLALAAGRHLGSRVEERATLACLVSAAGGLVFALAVGQDVRRTASLLIPLWVGAWLGARFRARSQQ